MIFFRYATVSRVQNGRGRVDVHGFDRKEAALDQVRHDHHRLPQGRVRLLRAWRPHLHLPGERQGQGLQDNDLLLREAERRRAHHLDR